MDEDTSGFASGLQGITIQGHATTPAMLYFKNGTSGYIKIVTGFSIIGTSGAQKGRLLANSDGVWGNTGSLAFADKALIDLGATSTISAQFLDMQFYCTQPTNRYVRTYGTKYDFTASGATVDVGADTIDLGVTPPSANTAVMVTALAGGTLPAGIEEGMLYYVRGISGTKCKLSLRSGADVFVDITGVGSGSCTLFTGHTNTSTATMNVLDNVTADTPWTTAAGNNRVCLASFGPQTFDQQRLTLTTINAGTIVLSANVDSVQAPGARIILSSRNVSIRSAATTSVNIVDYGSAATSAGIFQCEIVATAGTGTTFFGNGINSGTGHTMSGTVMGCTNGVYCSVNVRINGRLGAAGGVTANTSDFRFNNGADSAGLLVTLRAIQLSNALTFALRNIARVGQVGGKQGVLSEDHGRVLGASYAYWMMGDVIKNTSVVRTGGADSSMECVPLSNCAVNAPLLLLEWTEMSVPVALLTKSIYVKGEGWSTFPTAAQLYLEAEYVSNATTFATTTVASTQVLTDNTTWVQLSTPSFTPAVAGHIRYRAWLGAYEAASKVYVDAALY